MAQKTISSTLAKEVPSSGIVQNIGSILMATGKISSQDAERIRVAQEQKGLRFGDTGKALGLINDNDIQKALSYQFDFPFPDANDERFDKDLYAAYKPFSAQVESLRGIRSQLLLRWLTDTRKSLALLSPGSAEGRSSLTANLAIVFSQLGQRTLLIDADLRKPSQHKLFKFNGVYGLSDLLAGRADVSVITQIPVFHNLSVLPAGTIPPNPAELISRGLKNALQQLQPQYDVILVDTPSAEEAVDAQIVASCCGGALLLARQHHTRLGDLQALKISLQDTGCECLGVILAGF